MIAAANQAETGWLVFFARLTLRQAWARTMLASPGLRLGAFRRALFCWLSNLVIALTQLASNPGAWRDGKWQLVHVGIALAEPVQYSFSGIRWLLEATTPRVRKVRLANLLETDLRHAHLVPYRGLPSIEDFDALHRLAGEVVGIPYDRWGLVGVLANIGINSPDMLFCSELCAWAYQKLDLLPEGSVRIVNGAPVKALLPPGFWSPSELAREYGALSWKHEVYLEGA